MEHVDSTELAWAAGFFDGEGSTSLRKNQRKPILSVPQKHRECLQRFQDATGGLGRIYGVRRDGIYVWCIQNAKGVDTVLTLLWPYLSSIKREQAMRAGFQLGIIRSPKLGRPKKVVA